MGYNSKYTGAQIDALLDKINEGKTSTPRVAMTASSAVLAPDTFYVWGMADSLDLTLADGDAAVMNKYLFQFRNPKDSVTMLTLPDDITWSEDTELDENGLPVMEATAFYRIEIIEGLASLKKWKLAYIVFADAEVERVLMANGVGDGIGITKRDAAAVTTIGIWFKENAIIREFLELREFDNVKSLSTYAFTGCSSLEKIDISRVTAIGEYVFRNCTFLSEVVANWGAITTIGRETFAGCSNLVLDEVILANATIVDPYAFQDVRINVIDLGKVTAYPSVPATIGLAKKVIFPDTIVTTDFPRAFFDGSTIVESVRLSTNTRTILAYAFRNCNALREIVNIEYVTDIKDGGLESCSLTGHLELTNLANTANGALKGTALTSIHAPNLVTIAQQFCNDSPNLQKVEIGDKITTMGTRYSFSGCPNLTALIVRATTPPTSHNTMLQNSPNCIIYVPDEAVEAYKGATYWSAWASRIKGISEYTG